MAMSDTRMKLSETSDFNPPLVLRDRLGQTTEVNRAGRIFFGSALIISALGLWLVPGEPGDAAMQLIKLLVSVVLLALGAMFIFSLRQAAQLPEVQVDLKMRELRVLKHDKAQRQYVEARHGFDTLSEVILQDRLLIARDKAGHTVASVPLPDEATEKAIRSLLEGAI